MPGGMYVGLSDLFCAKVNSWIWVLMIDQERQ